MCPRSHGWPLQIGIHFLFWIGSSLSACGTELTFLVWSDPHFDAYNGYGQRDNCVADMNRIPGTPYPASVGGTVGRPVFVILSGDITENDLESQYSNTDGDTNNDFLSCVTNLDYPCYIVRGNHDIALNRGSDTVVRQHGELYYSFDRQGVHFVALDTVGVSPQTPPAMIAWLQEDLSRLSPGTPVIPFFHYNPEESSDWEDLRVSLSGHNIPVILHGHTHRIYKTTWYGTDVYSTGHNKQEDAGNEGFTVVHITDDRLTCVAYDWQHDRWHSDSVLILAKPVTGLPRENNPPRPTPTPLTCMPEDLLVNGDLESFAGTHPNQIAASWTGMNVIHTNFRSSPGMRGRGYGQTIERRHDQMESGEGFIYQTIDVTPGHTYRLTAWGRPENGGDGSPPSGFAPDTAKLEYGIGLDPTGGTAFASLPPSSKLIHDTSEPAYMNLAYYPFELTISATGNRMTAFLYYRVAEWKYRPPRVVWDHCCLTDLDSPPPTPRHPSLIQTY